MKDRVVAAYQIIREEEALGKEEQNRIESVLYVMADKFLDSEEMDGLMEVISMTRLGQKLVNKGKEEGRQEEKLEIAGNLQGLLNESVIAEKMNLPLEIVLELKEKKESARTV